MNEWSKYGQCRHKIQWWDIQIKNYLKLKHPERLFFSLNVCNVTDVNVHCTLENHPGIMVFSKKKVAEEMNFELLN